eukprot:Pgem_evm1s884
MTHHPSSSISNVLHTNIFNQASNTNINAFYEEIDYINDDENLTIELRDVGSSSDVSHHYHQNHHQNHRYHHNNNNNGYNINGNECKYRSTKPQYEKEENVYNDSRIRNREIRIKKLAGENFGAIFAMVHRRVFVVYISPGQYLSRDLEDNHRQYNCNVQTDSNVLNIDGIVNANNNINNACCENDNINTNVNTTYNRNNNDELNSHINININSYPNNYTDNNNNNNNN